MPKYIQSGGKFFTVGDRNQLQQITESDILGRRGDVPGGANLDLIRKEGDIIDIDPSKLALSPNIEHDGTKPGEFVIPELQRAGFNPILRSQAEFQALGLTPQAGVQAGGQVPFNQEFANYLKETGQSFSNGQFSGTGARPGGLPASSQPQAQGPQQATQLTPAQSTNANNTLYKQWNGSNWDVFNADGTPMKDIKRFESGELNIDHINTKQVLGSRTPGKVEADKTFADGATTTGMFGSETSDFFKSIADRFAKTDEMVANILTAGERSEEEKKLKGQIGEITSSFEAGLTDINGQTIPMQLIIGQGAELERRATDKIKALTRLLDTYKDDREAKYNALVKAYDLSRNSTNDMIALYKLTQPDKIWTDTDNGKVYFQNPMTGVISSKDLPGFTGGGKPSEVKEYEYLQSHDMLPASIKSYAGYVQWKAKQYGTEGTNDYNKELNSQIEAIYSGDYGTEGSREKAIARLQSLYPGKDVAKDIYNRVPNGYEKNIVPKQTSSVQKAGRLQELLGKSNNGKSLDLLTPAEQAELYSLL